MRTKAFPLRGRWHGEAVTDEVPPTPKARAEAQRPFMLTQIFEVHPRMSLGSSPTLPRSGSDLKGLRGVRGSAPSSAPTCVRFAVFLILFLIFTILTKGTDIP